MSVVEEALVVSEDEYLDESFVEEEEYGEDEDFLREDVSVEIATSSPTARPPSELESELCQRLGVLRDELKDEEDEVKIIRRKLRVVRDKEQVGGGGSGDCGGRRAGRRGIVEGDAGEGNRLSRQASSGGGGGQESSPCREIALGDVKLGEELSGGGFCIMYDATWAGIKVAVKRIFDPVITDELKAEFSNEVNMLASLRHPNVVSILGACSKPPSLLIITEFLERGSLFHTLHLSKVELTRSRKLWFSIQVARGLAFVHANNCVHRDIKSYNMLVDKNLVCKVCDFGLARRLPLTPGTSAAGTVSYIAPELWRHEQGGLPADVYAVGILLNEIWALEVPFDGMDANDCRTRVLKGVRPDTDPKTPEAVNELIRDCWADDPTTRPTMQHIVDHLDSLKFS
jgi:serine/threonine protein kinase